MAVARVEDQHAYMFACLDTTLSEEMARTCDAQLPIFGAQNSCVNTLQEIFRRRFPLILRRKNFLAQRQKPGQDARAFFSQLQASAIDANCAGMQLNDLICAMYLLGVTDSDLVRRLTEEPNPTIENFRRIADAHLQAQVALGPAAAQTTARQQQNKRRNGQQQQQAGQRSQQQNGKVSEKERTRRSLIGRDRCFRCAGAHLGKDCKHNREVVCNNCKEVGHVTPACLPVLQAKQARAVTEDRPGSVASYHPPPPPAPGPPQQQPHQQLMYTAASDYGWAEATSNATTAVARSMPTPSMNV